MSDFTELSKPISTAMSFEDKKIASNSLNKSIAKQSSLLDFRYWQNKSNISLDNPVHVEKRLSEYFDYIQMNTLMPSYEGMAMALKISSSRLNQIEAYMTAGIETSEIISKYKTMIGMMDYQLALDGILSPAVYELRAGHYQGITRKTDINFTPNTPVKQATPDELERMIKENQAKHSIIDIDDE